MIVSIWVFFMLGDPTPAGTGIAYVQATASPWQHDHRPDQVEAMCRQEFAACFPGHTVADSGWRQQGVKVMGDG